MTTLCPTLPGLLALDLPATLSIDWLSGAIDLVAVLLLALGIKGLSKVRSARGANQLAAAAMGLAVEVVLLGAASLGAWAILLAMVVAVPVYGISLTMLGGATKEDLQNLPFIGRRVLALGQRFGYFKN